MIYRLTVMTDRRIRDFPAVLATDHNGDKHTLGVWAFVNASSPMTPPPIDQTAPVNLGQIPLRQTVNLGQVPQYQEPASPKRKSKVGVARVKSVLSPSTIPIGYNPAWSSR